MAHSRELDADSRVRDYIHAWTVDQVARWENNALTDGDVKFARYIRECWQPRIDALYEGRAVLISRFELPRKHPMSPKYGGDPGDHFELGPDDVLRPYKSSEPHFRPNRAQRRAAGQRVLARPACQPQMMLQVMDTLNRLSDNHP